MRKLLREGSFVEAAAVCGRILILQPSLLDHRGVPIEHPVRSGDGSTSDKKVITEISLESSHTSGTLEPPPSASTLYQKKKDPD